MRINGSILNKNTMNGNCMELIKAESISKKYNKQLILNGVNLSIKKGEAIALVGENGCGKSTLLRILSGITNQSGGKVIAAPDLRFAFIPDRYEKINMTIRRFIKHMTALEGIERFLAEDYCREYSLENMLDIPMKYLSKGSLQKVAVIQALLSERDVLIMDEPLSGQDTYSKAEFAAELRKRKENGMAIIMACHEPYLIEELADSILQIKNGELIDGAEYIFSQRKPVCHFVIDYKGSDSELINSIVNKEISRSMNISRVGPMFMIKADREYSKELFQILLSHDIHIVKYEESEEKC
jgi:ABC-2 type transport system ATP-binding protein